MLTSGPYQLEPADRESKSYGWTLEPGKDQSEVSNKPYKMRKFFLMKSERKPNISHLIENEWAYDWCD